MRAFVTGMGGFVGAHLAARLVADGWEVAGTVRPGGDTARLRALGLVGSVQVLRADLSDPAAAAAVAAPGRRPGPPGGLVHLPAPLVSPRHRRA